MRVPRFAAHILPLTALVALVALAACGDATAPGARRPAPVALLSDGSRDGGNADFFFLPPVAANPSGHPDFSPGQFAGSWRPVVEVCKVSAANLGAGCVGGAVKRYPSSTIAVASASEHYQVQVDTREAWAVGGETYRFHVIVIGNRPDTLGFVDIALLAGSAKNAVSGDLIAMQDGRTIPLKFRIEKGATIDPDVEVFAEATVTNAGATVLAGGTGGPGTYALQFPAGWLPAGLDQVVVTVERLSEGPGGLCTASVPELVQTSDCWRVESYPEIPRIEQTLTVAFCPAIPRSDPRYDAQTMYKFDAPETLVELPNVATTLVNCDGSTAIGRAPDDLLGKVRWGATHVARGLGKLFGPNTAYAVDLGWGGHIVATDAGTSLPDGVFSEFFWAIPLQVSVHAGNGQSAAPSTRLGTPISVRVVGAHEHVEGEAYRAHVPIPNVKVTFSPNAGSGFAGSTTVMTDANGVASTTWTLGAGTGTQTMVASITSIGAQTTATFTASAAASVLIFSGDMDITGTTQTIRGSYSETLVVSTTATSGCSLATSDPNVVNVDGFLVVATGRGTAVVTATCGTASASVTYVVEPVVAIRLVDNNTNYAGRTTTVTTAFSAGFRVATEPATGESCTLTSSNPAVVQVYASGTLWVFSPTGTAGTVVVTGTCGDVTGTATFNVILPPISSITVIHGGENVVPETNQVTLWVGQSEPFVAQPMSGTTAVPQQACTFNLVNPPTVAFTSMHDVTANSAIVTANVSSGTGSSTLQITCGAATRNITIFTSAPTT